MLLNVTLCISISVLVITLVVTIDESNLELSVESVELNSVEEIEMLLKVSKVSDEVFIIEE